MDKSPQEQRSEDQTFAPRLEDLLESISRQDRDAFAEFYQETSTKVYSLALRVVRNAMLAEEIAQEVYLTVWQDASNYEQARGKPLSWVLTICHRKCVDHIRQEEARKKRENSYASLNNDEASMDIEPEVISRIAAEHISSTLETLSSKQTAVVELVYFEGLTIKEAAETLDVPLATAKTRLRDALNNLKKKLRSEKNV